MENKLCPKCGTEKALNCFHQKNSSKTGASSWCKTCLYETQKKRWTDRKIEAVKLLGGKCCKCGYNKNYAALDFHHVNPKEKEFDWKKCRQLPWNKLIEELKKCICVCRNCHAEIHNPQALMEGLLEGLSSTANNSLNRECIKETGLCPVCKEEKLFGTKYCSKHCASMARRIVKRPNKDKLKELINEFPIVKIGKLFNVSDNAVRKWMKFYDMSP